MNDNEWEFAKVGFWGLRWRKLCLSLICHKLKPLSLMTMMGGGVKLGRLGGYGGQRESRE